MNIPVNSFLKHCSVNKVNEVIDKYLSMKTIRGKGHTTWILQWCEKSVWPFLFSYCFACVAYINVSNYKAHLNI